MTEQQLHLQQLIKQQSEIAQEIQSLNTLLLSKREILLKVQGAIEYLQQTGVTLPEATEEVETSQEVES
jgi:hypothetical protein